MTNEMGIRSWYRELNDATFEDPRVETVGPDARRVERFANTSAGPITINAYGGFAAIIRYAPDGAAVTKSWRWRLEDGLAETIEAAGVPADEARTIAATVEPLIRPLPPPPSQRARRLTLARLTLALIARWALGLYTLERLIRERRRR